MFERSTISRTTYCIYIIIYIEYMYTCIAFDLGGCLWFPDFIFHNYLATTSILWMDWVNHGQLWQAGRAEFRGLAPHGSGKCCVSPSRPLASERLGASRRHLNAESGNCQIETSGTQGNTLKFHGERPMVFNAIVSKTHSIEANNMS